MTLEVGVVVMLGGRRGWGTRFLLGLLGSQLNSSLYLELVPSKCVYFFVFLFCFVFFFKTIIIKVSLCAMWFSVCFIFS